MQLLATANLLGLEPDTRDKDGHTPSECFLRCRSSHCAVVRESFDVEKQIWTRLMRSARGHGEVLREVFDDNDITVVEDDFSDKRKDSFMSNRIVDESESEDEFVDAEDGFDAQR
tara:strand:+ start:3817 stop:4161 length:345 start_codon:yes stop_codon:yes gene_type:complete